MKKNKTASDVRSKLEEKGLDKQEIQNILIEDARTGLSVEALKRAISNNLFYAQGKFPEIATRHDYYMAVSYAVRDRILNRWVGSVKQYLNSKNRVVSYLSAEYLLGPHLANNLINLGIYKQVEQAVKELGKDLDWLIEKEIEPGLGNGGLGRLAACYMDSLATLEVPAIGYGIRYQFGIFEQDIKDGWQVEDTDNWLRRGNPWEIERRELNYEVKFGGHVQHYTDNNGKFCSNWIPDLVVKGVAYDTPILGYKVNTTNTLRLWKSEAPKSFDFQVFNAGGYNEAVRQKIVCENISKVLYPNDEQEEGKILRLQQQYFFVSCSLQDMINIHLRQGDKIHDFHQKFVVQLNDTHPAVGVAEMMRLLLDKYMLDWDDAWDITTKTFAYTNHTLLPEALEKWDLELFGKVLPRHLELIYEINRRFIDKVTVRFYGDHQKIASLSLIGEGPRKYIKMANLAALGSQAINGVAALHTDLLKKTVMKDWFELSPEKFSNKTNGVTPRRWMVLSNPQLTELISSKIGEGWIKNLDELKDLEQFAKDKAFQKAWMEVKHDQKINLSKKIFQRMRLTVDPDSLFDVQVKRIHEYKRQLLNALHVITLYNRIKQKPEADIVPRTVIFAGKAAPGYKMAKLIIKLITSIGDVVNNDSDVNKKLKVVFFPNYNVTNAQKIYPAADLSEQISTSGKEASGTGNMKLSLNGALTIGTLDGANVEIRECVGEENFFLFGLTADEVENTKANGYDPYDYYKNNPELKLAIDQINEGYFSHLDPDTFKGLVRSLMFDDQYLILADYQAYVDAQEKVAETFKNKSKWAEMSILNVARMGKFSSDRSIRDYCKEIWKVEPVPVKLEN
ncbi:Glycogen phosphorylase [Indibacter alkaliphilus LW1]|uniref:Alpha-1,4 glucan phosphorylase n=1 Tax=Indibacter alkaliphilus (strain CCUG 57479 / KCTC 22604 / LW1) TaxID=1189612 RepID=S2DHS1_INDAL|nr:glycogen/starch/alpha-glucan phosphorylase [Indibacter alkaliphilus]EOZ98524.1 Glycogen phosphorylase [Indibacter alkaliphilus LW1]